MLNPEEEARFKKLREDCRALGVASPPEVHIGLQVRDPDGNLTFDDVQRGHSWTRNFYNYLFMTTADAAGSGSNSFAAGVLSGKAYDGTIEYSASGAAQRYTVTLLGSGYHNISNNAAFGILVGTGATAFSAEQSALAALIAHGNSGGQFYHQSMVAPVQLYTAGTKTWKNTIKRIFNNNSGGLITVAESGLYFYATMTQNIRYYMFERSVLAPTVAVANGAQLTVTYTISMDFSAVD